MKKDKQAFEKGLRDIIDRLTKKYGISQSKLLNSGGGSGEEFVKEIEALRHLLQSKHGVTVEQFNTYFEEYIK
jgi:hypothetical protein